MDVRTEIPKDDIGQYFGFTMELLDKARTIVLQMMKEKFATSTKADASFVTDVDLAVETMIRDEVTRYYPEHGVLGEELPTLRPDSPFRWITDPVDGTQNLVHRLPTFGCIVGLHYKGRPVVGGIDHPLLDLRYTAGLDLGCWENGQRISIVDEPMPRLEVNEIVALSTRAMFERSGEGLLFDRFMASHPSTRVFYDCFATTRAVAGQVGALVEFNVRLWDLAATEILVTEAGGVYEEIRLIPQPDGKEPLRSAILGKASVVDILKRQFASS